MSDDAITSEHTCARIGQVLQELEALRLEMGRDRDARIPMHVSDASPREVYYHAQTVHRKANQLCVELGAPSVAAPAAAEPVRAQPADVLRVLDSARERIARARAHLHLEGDDPPPELPGPLVRAEGKVASDVLAGCLVASRQLNTMLAHAFASREGHEQLIRALGITGRLLAYHGSELPAAPPFERRKAPRDVFSLLWKNYGVLQKILRDAGVSALAIHREFVGEQPTDVYDIASLIVSELEYLASFLPLKEGPPLLVATPTPVLPAHNFRRARQIEAAFDLLVRTLPARPGWLRQP